MRVKVKVANYELLLSEGRCKAINVKMKGVMISIDVHVSALEGYDIVLSIQWSRGILLHVLKTKTMKDKTQHKKTFP